MPYSVPGVVETCKALFVLPTRCRKFTYNAFDNISGKTFHT